MSIKKKINNIIFELQLANRILFVLETDRYIGPLILLANMRIRTLQW